MPLMGFHQKNTPHKKIDMRYGGPYQALVQCLLGVWLIQPALVAFFCCTEFLSITF
ncbi:hypothetical protein Lepto7375DRAFT_6421 [Leptolyngbya sp. PCC 7375]|nr:hypothetical protein Lepto7375DRAFT_6421 [Leptolyngbya sp. PCC 7375]